MFRALIPRIWKARAPRHGAYEAIGIDAGPGQPSQLGVLKELSSTGALIHVENAASLPDQIWISIESCDIHTAADIRWRRRGYIGVQFPETVDVGQLPQRYRQNRAAVVAGHFRRR